MRTWYIKTPFFTLQGAEIRCLDWVRAAEFIKENYRPGMRVWAGIKGDWEDTAGIIFESGNAVNADAVVNAERMNDEPMLLIRYKNGTLLELSCWKYSNELDYVGDKWPFKLSMSKERNYES